VGERTETSTAGLLPIQNRYGLWGRSLGKAASSRLLGGAGREGSLLSAILWLIPFACIPLLTPAASSPLRLFSVWNLALGISFGFLLARGLRCVPVAAIGCLLVPLLGPGQMGWSPALAFGLGQAAAAGIGAAVLLRASEVPSDVTQRHSLVGFIVTAPVVAVLAAALTSVFAFALGVRGGSGLSAAVASGFWGNLVGILLIGPAAALGVRRLSGLGPEALVAGVRRVISIGDVRPCVKRALVPGIALVAAGYLMLNATATSAMALFGVISVPVVLAALLLGLNGVIPVLAVCALAGLGRLAHGPDVGLSLQLASVAAALNGSVIGLLITEKRRLQSTLNQQAGLMDTVSFAARQLLDPGDRDSNVIAVLRSLVREARLDRAYVLENRRAARAGTYPVVHEHGQAIPPDANEALDTLRSRHILHNARALEQGQVLELQASSLPPTERSVLGACGVRSTLILPVFAEGHWWGCLGIDQCSEPRAWSGAEIATFQATAGVLGALLAHVNVEQQFRQFTGSIPVVFWTASPDALHKTYVSPAYEQIWGRPRDGIRENPRSWMGAVCPEDYQRLAARLEGAPEAEFAEEYRIVRPDGSRRWIRDTGFAVLDATGRIDRIVGIAQDITAQKEAEERLRASEEQVRSSLTEKEVLLKEIHHRVKNNLQVISSLLSLQATQIEDAAAAQVFQDSQSRVRAMALVHERLYRSEDLARIDFAGYVRDMTGHLLRSWRGEARGIRLLVDVSGVSLDIDAAIPCALIINELVSNAFKYAFPDGRSGEIRIGLTRNDDSVTVVVRDDGVGLPEGTSLEKAGSLGLQLVQSLTDQLGGQVKCSSRAGTRFEVRFPYKR
jgi:PAS domain S-box-containing protein